MRRLFSLSLLSFGFFVLSGCASKFPTPISAPFISTDNALTGQKIYTQSFNAHGGAKLDELSNLNVSLTGKWKQLIRRIQPLVTDFGYRVDSQERILPKARIYAANYKGPSGTKSVYRTPESTAVRYNGVASLDSQVLSSTALTADSFHLFLLGPLALEKWQDQATRISDKKMNGRNHWRVHFNRSPGLGLANRDDVVLWVDPKTKLTTRVQITLFGHDTTQAAHVEVDYLDYKKVQGYVFPSIFFERVKAPIAIDAHGWHLTGLDINRDYGIDDIANGFKNAAQTPADSSLFD